MMSIQSVIRKSLIRSAVLVILAVFLLTNLGFTWMFSQYIAQIRANEVALVLEAVSEAFADGNLEASEITLLRQTANQSSVHLLINDSPQSVIFDSTIGGNGNKRPLLSRQKEVLEPSDMMYTEYKVQVGEKNIDCQIGQQRGWLINREDIGFLLGVNLVYLIILIIAVPTVWYFSKWLSDRLSRPILQIHSATEKIHGGDYHLVTIDKSGTLELDDLALAIENLAFQMDQQEGLRKRLTTDIAHELRSPLAVLRSQLEGLSDGVLEATPERYERLNGEILRLTKLIDDLSELTLVENDLYVLKLQLVNVSRLTKEIVEDFKPVFESKGILLSYEAPPDLNWQLDLERYKQILVNLLTNSLKYTDEGSASVRLFKVGDGLVLEVEDTGIGIEEKNISFIFQRFYRADPSRSRETGGAGIGLAIVKRLVHAHGGQIEATSVFGKGTKIRIHFTSPS